MAAPRGAEEHGNEALALVRRYAATTDDPKKLARKVNGALLPDRPLDADAISAALTVSATPPPARPPKPPKPPRRKAVAHAWTDAETAAALEMANAGAWPRHVAAALNERFNPTVPFTSEIIQEKLHRLKRPPKEPTPRRPRKADAAARRRKPRKPLERVAGDPVNRAWTRDETALALAMTSEGAKPRHVATAINERFRPHAPIKANAVSHKLNHLKQARAKPPRTRKDTQFDRWDEEATDLMLALAATGRSSQDVADAMNGLLRPERPFTRGMVIGRMDRVRRGRLALAPGGNRRPTA